MVNAAALGSAANKAASGGKAAKRSSSGQNLLNREKAPSFSAQLRRPNTSLAAREENPDSETVGENRTSRRQTPSFLYSKSQSSKAAGKPGKKKLSLKSLSKSAPLLLLGGILIGAFALFGGTSSLLPAHIDENTQEAYDIQHYASQAALKTITKGMLTTGSIPSGFAKRLSDSGIEVGFLDNNGTFIAGLHPNPDTSVNLANSSDSKKIIDNSLVLKFKDMILNADDFAESVTIDPELYSAFSDATYGRAINHFDSAADSFYANIKNSRNVFRDYTVTSDNETDMQNFRDTLISVFQNTNDSTVSFLSEIEKETGNTYAARKQKVTNAEEDALKTFFNQVGDASKDEVAIANIASLANEVINANETYQSMQYYLTLEETISKMKAGESGSTPINSAMNFFTTSTTSEIQNTDGTTSEVTGSPVQSPGLSSVLAKSYSSNLASETSKYSLDRIINYGGDEIATLYSKNSKIAANTAVAVSNAANTVNIALDNTSVTVSTAASTLLQDLSYVVTSKGADTTKEAVQKFVAAITPSISKSILFENAGEKLSGIPAGEFFAKGGATLGNHIATFAAGGTIGDAESIASFSTYSDKILALEAEADRLNHSPFDITNKNTFLGSIVSDFSNLVLTSNTFSSIFSSLSSLANASLLSILPKTFAATTEDNSFRTVYGNCPALEKIGAKGDIYCNPIITFDVHTINNALSSTDFENFLEKNAISLNINPENSVNLTKTVTAERPSDQQTWDNFIKYNQGRQSTFGTQDANIYKEVEVSTTIIQNIQDIIAGIEQKIEHIFNEGEVAITGHEYESEILATGSAFLNSGSNDFWLGGYAYCQAYVVYSRALEQMEYFSEDNTNEAALSKYFTPGTGQFPVSTYLANLVESYKNETDSEYVSRIAGITEEDAKLALGYISYASYLASIDYDSKYYPYESANYISKIFIKSNSKQPFVASSKKISYNTLRNRNYAA